MSAFEADRFNHSRTSPHEKSSLVVRLWPQGLKPVNRDSCGTTEVVLSRFAHRLAVIAIRFANDLRRTTNDWFLAPASEKLLQQLGAAAGQHAWLHLHAVIQ